MESSQDTMNVPKRTSADYISGQRSELKSHLKTELTKTKTIDPGNKITDFLARRLWSWLYHYIKSRFGPTHEYPSYSSAETGIYQMQKSAKSTSESVSIAVVSDWGTDTADSFTIADQIKKHDPDYTIHVGDTYFVGAPHEIKSNFTAEGSPWVRGNVGSFALLGNHEMYARGDAFFKYLLPSLGIRTEAGTYNGQKAGYFCLENKYWRIFGLDTGYHSIGKYPIVELLPWCGPDSRLDKKLLDWLQNIALLGNPNDKRGILFLTHHQYITAFNKELEYIVPAEQLASNIGKDRKVLWIWGHEHKFSLYEKAQIKKGITAYGRCLGHGGSPVELNGGTFKKSAKKQGFKKLVMVDKRLQKEINGSRLGYNGYAVIRINDSELKLEYYDNKRFLLSETWQVDESGNISGSIDATPECPLMPEPGKSWADATRP